MMTPKQPKQQLHRAYSEIEAGCSGQIQARICTLEHLPNVQTRHDKMLPGRHAHRGPLCPQHAGSCDASPDLTTVLRMTESQTASRKEHATMAVLVRWPFLPTFRRKTLDTHLRNLMRQLLLATHLDARNHFGWNGEKGISIAAACVPVPRAPIPWEGHISPTHWSDTGLSTS